MVEYTPQEYLFVLQTILGEDTCVAYASVFDAQNFKRNVPSENEEEYLSKFKKQAELLLEDQSCVHLREYLETEYKRDIQEQASTLQEFHFTGDDVKKILNNLLKDRTTDLSESSVKDITSILKMMYENGSLDSGDNFQRHFVTIPKKYDCICAGCNKEMYAVEGIDNKCPNCGMVYKWANERFYPKMEKL